MENEGSPLIALVAGLIFCAAGVLGIIFRAPVTRFFRDGGTSLWGPRVGGRVYTQRNLMWAFVPALIFGVIIVVVAVTHLVSG